MSVKSLARALALLIAVTFGPGIASAAPGPWTSTVATTDGGHLIGNPQAKTKLIEFVSYTCPHCAHFAREGDAPLLLYIGTGKMNLEVRHVVRDPVDLTVAMLTNCGPVAKFPLNHNAFMLSQNSWLPTMGKASPVQKSRWSNGDYSARRRAIAADFGFYQIMERRGYRRTDVDKCLNDQKKAEALAAASEGNFEEFQLAGTPSFAIDGVLLAGTHSWDMLKPQLDARF